jgi:hypothetical protein
MRNRFQSNEEATAFGCLNRIRTSPWMNVERIRSQEILFDCLLSQPMTAMTRREPSKRGSPKEFYAITTGVYRLVAFFAAAT